MWHQQKTPERKKEKHLSVEGGGVMVMTEGMKKRWRGLPALHQEMDDNKIPLMGRLH